MSIRLRLERLEEAMPEKGSDLRLICKSIVRRDGNGLLWEKPVIVMLVRLPAAPHETIQRHESESQADYLERVQDAIRRIDPAEAETFDWQPQPGTHHTE